MRSISRLVVAVAFVLALVLATVPAHAQPRDFGSSGLTVDASWLDVALGWLDSLLGGSGPEPLQSMEASGYLPPNPGGNVGSLGGVCIDPYGGCGQ